MLEYIQKRSIVLENLPAFADARMVSQMIQNADAVKMDDLHRYEFVFASVCPIFFSFDVHSSLCQLVCVLTYARKSCEIRTCTVTLVYFRSCIVTFGNESKMLAAFEEYQELKIAHNKIFVRKMFRPKMSRSRLLNSDTLRYADDVSYVSYVVALA